MERLRSKLRRAFSNKPNVVQTRAGAFPVAVKSMHAHWIVGRGLCMYRCEDFRNVPRARRPGALALKLPVWSPFEHTGHHAVWAGPVAMVWLWNQAEVEALRQGQPAADVRVLPETVFFKPPADGLHVRECAEGHDLQHWQGGVLRDAYWLAEPPAAQTLAWFVERQPRDPDLPPPDLPTSDAAPLPWHVEDEPWAGRETPAQWLQARERAVVATGLLALLLPLAWQEARIWKMHGLAQATAAEMARMQDDIDPMLGAREEWLRLRERNQALAAVLAEPSQAYVMSLVDEAIPNADASFHTWRYQQRELLFVVEDANLDPVEYTRALQALPLFDQVRMQPQRRAGQFEITLAVAAGADRP